MWSSSKLLFAHHYIDHNVIYIYNFQWRNFQYSRTSTPKVQTPWNQADAPLLLESFPKRPRTRSEASQFGGSHKYKQNKTNKLPCFIDRSWSLSFIGILKFLTGCYNFVGAGLSYLLRSNYQYIHLPAGFTKTLPFNPFLWKSRR